MSGNTTDYSDFVEWETHEGGGTTPVEAPSDGRIPVYLSKKGMYFTLFGDQRRQWGGAEPTISKDNIVGDFNTFTLRGEKESFWLNKFDFQLAPQDFISKTYRQSLPVMDEPLIIADTGQLVSPQGDLLPYQPSIRSDRGDFLNADSYIFPPKFIRLMPELSERYPDLSNVELYKQYLESLTMPPPEETPAEETTPPQETPPPAEETPAPPEETPAPPANTNNWRFYKEDILAQYPDVQPQTLRNAYQSAKVHGSASSLNSILLFMGRLDGQGAFNDFKLPQEPEQQQPEEESITIPVVEQEPEDTSPDPQLLLPAPDTSGQDTDSIFDGSLTPYHLNILDASQAQHSLSVYDNRASQLQSGLHRGENIDTGDSESKQQAPPRPFGQILEVYA